MPCSAWGICSQEGYGVSMSIASSATRTQGLAGVQVTVTVWPCIPAVPVWVSHTPCQHRPSCYKGPSPWVRVGHEGQFLVCKGPTNLPCATWARAVGWPKCSLSWASEVVTMLMTEFRSHHPQLHHHTISEFSLSPVCLPHLHSAMAQLRAGIAARELHHRSFQVSSEKLHGGQLVSMTLVPHPREWGCGWAVGAIPFPVPIPSPVPIPQAGVSLGHSPLLRASSSSPYGAGGHQLSSCISRLQWALSASPQGESLPEG